MTDRALFVRLSAVIETLAVAETRADAACAFLLGQYGPGSDDAYRHALHASAGIATSRERLAELRDELSRERAPEVA